MTPHAIDSELRSKFGNVEWLPFTEVVTFILNHDATVRAEIEAEMRKAIEKEKELKK